MQTEILNTPKTLTTESLGGKALVYLSDETGTKRCITDMNTARMINSALSRMKTLEGFVQKFLENFKDCDACNGSGWNEEQDDSCDVCKGSGQRIASQGVLFIELPEEARALLKGQTS